MGFHPNRVETVMSASSVQHHKPAKQAFLVHFAALADPRQSAKIMYPLKEIVLLVVCAKRCPNPHQEMTAVEIRPAFDADDFGEAMTAEMHAQEERVFADAKRNAGT